MSNLPNLNEPNQNGVGLFFAVVRSAINNCEWKRSDFDKVNLVEGQLDALQEYFTGKAVVKEVTGEAPKEEIKVEEPKKIEVDGEEIDLTDKGEKRVVPMPDSIAQIAIDAREAQRDIDRMPPPPVTEAPMPKTDQEYDTIF